VLADHHVPYILEDFDLGSWGRLSGGPVASGRLGSIWRLDTERGSWAVKQVGDAGEVAELLDGAAFQEAVLAAGIATPAVRRTRTGEVIAAGGGARVRLHGWVDLHDADPGLDPVEVGQLVAALHRVDFAGSIGLDPWYTEPVGRCDGPSWSRRSADAAPRSPTSSTRCSRSSSPWRRTSAVRRAHDGGLCVFDFDNAGLADPSQELAAVLVEYGAEPGRAARVRAAYAEAGGPGRVEDETDGIAALLAD
jgi:hypothetical protein